MCSNRFKIEGAYLIEKSGILSKPCTMIRFIVQDLFDGGGCFCHLWLLRSQLFLLWNIAFFFCCFSYQETEYTGLRIKSIVPLKKTQDTPVLFFKENACTLFHIYIHPYNDSVALDRLPDSVLVH